jgi:hypothetical protein
VSGQFRDNTALVRTGRQLPARAELLNRGLALADVLLSNAAEARYHAIVTNLTNARRALSTALEMAEGPPTTGPLRFSLRETCLSAFDWGLMAAMMIYRAPFSESQEAKPFSAGAVLSRADDLGSGAEPLPSADWATIVADDLRAHFVAAGFLWEEGVVTVNIRRHLLDLVCDDDFEFDHFRSDMATFLNDAAAFWEDGADFWVDIVPSSVELQRRLPGI